MIDPRHLARIKIIQNLYASEFIRNGYNFPYPNDLKTKAIISKKNEIDSLIKKYAPRFPLDEIAKVDLAILRWAIYDILFEKKISYKVIIDEAIELAKELSSMNSYSFINGVLGSFIKDYFHEPD